MCNIPAVCRISAGIVRRGQHKFCPDKQQYINAKLFPVYVVVVENYYECFKYGART